MSIDRHTPRKYNKQVLPVEMLQRFLVEAIGDDLAEAVSAFYDRGVSFGNAITIAAAGNDAFSLQCGGTGKTIMALDGIGGVMRVKHGDLRLTGVHFENTSGTPYFVGLERASYPAAPSDSHPLDINTVTLKPEYRLYQDTFGRVGHPGSVTVNGNGTITLGLDSLLLDPGADHAGRKVKVWLKEPISSDPEIAIQELTSTFSSGTNKVTTPNTAVVKTLGQETPSTDVTDYLVLVEGPTVTQNWDLLSNETIELNGTVEFQKDSLTGTVFLKGTDTAFTSQLSAGSKLKIYGESRTVLKVNSDTEAIVDRGSDAEPEGVKATICGIQYIGTIEGGGPTAAYDSASTAQQRVVQFTLADLTRAFRRDSHGFVKVSVLADPSDNNEDQIRVVAADGTTVVFRVDEDGDITGQTATVTDLFMRAFWSYFAGESSGGSGDKWRFIGEWGINSTATTTKIRLFHSTQWTGGEVAFAITINAKFQSDGEEYDALWSRDDNSKDSARYLFYRDGRIVIQDRVDTNADTWGETDWETDTGADASVLASVLTARTRFVSPSYQFSTTKTVRRRRGHRAFSGDASGNWEESSGGAGTPKYWEHSGAGTDYLTADLDDMPVGAQLTRLRVYGEAGGGSTFNVKLRRLNLSTKTFGTDIDTVALVAAQPSGYGEVSVSAALGADEVFVVSALSAQAGDIVCGIEYDFNGTTVNDLISCV